MEINKLRVAAVLEAALEQYYHYSTAGVRACYMCYILQDHQDDLGLSRLEVQQVRQMISAKIDGYLTLSFYLQQHSTEYSDLIERGYKIGEEPTWVQQYEMRIQWYRDWIVELRANPAQIVGEG